MPSRFVVCGPPHSGKTTYVRERLARNDLVWDTDAVLAAIAPPHSGETWDQLPLYLTQILLVLREAFIAYLERTHTPGASVYITGVSPETATDIAGRIGAQVIEKTDGGWLARQ